MQVAVKYGDETEDAGLQIVLAKIAAMLKKTQKEVIRERFERHITPEKQKQIITSGNDDYIVFKFKI